MRKNRRVSNNVLAVVVLAMAMASGLGSYLLITSIPQDVAVVFTGYSTATGTASLCVNTMPSINIGACGGNVNVTKQYYCVVTASDDDSGTVFSFHYKTSLFNISLLTGAINFTPNRSYIGNYDILLTANDGSQCATSNATAVLSLLIQDSCSAQSPPSFVNLAASYSIPRRHSFELNLS